MTLKGGGFKTIVLIPFTIPIYCQATGGWNRSLAEPGAEEQDAGNL